MTPAIILAVASIVLAVMLAGAGGLARADRSDRVFWIQNTLAITVGQIALITAYYEGALSCPAF